MPEPYWGKYRAQVADNRDPVLRGRLKLIAPAVSEQPLDWAEACLSHAEAGCTDRFIPPPVGTAVWVEFEGGSIHRPVWTGCLWPER